MRQGLHVIVGVIVLLLLVPLVWVWRGRRWARITMTVILSLLGIGAVFSTGIAIVNLSLGASDPQIFSAPVIAVTTVGALVLLWRGPEAAAYFRTSREPVDEIDATKPIAD